ncbi:hypothetical protein PTTG_28818 [Puccinia triticina 1-1 BBBD Race 1]|uniref:DUF659 domain-containing protein n=1 Tax=Puccinia triticina (isolate 1-1 / race 1 (BBBD)) TaxID=630390 RepID=A0A180G9S9_PUCT1|nr:hypothetical protein PTTG_28818 [Puccinia triticina 1-1 BBBD Race 1]
MPLDFIWLSESHTGEYIANSVHMVVEKFGIQNKIHRLVTDNASKNEAMMSELKRLKWPHFKGKTQWIRCFAHILNLIVKAILWPFGTEKKKKNVVGEQEGSVLEDDDAAAQIRVLTHTDKPTSGSDEYSSKEELLVDKEDEDEYLGKGDIDEDEDEDRYTSGSCKHTLAKICVIAKKLRFSPNSKADFVENCQAKECKTPHNIERDRNKRHRVDRKHQLDDSDFDLACDLVEILNLFYEITLQVLVAGSTWLSNIVIFIDQITDHLSTVIKATTKYPQALRNAC